ncbi:SDR family NAD(P)-dependent oxidoreductase [Kineococcus sp. R86509]|uniref:SDR family NAD(P)-dependent oxidoreductase n=1 Tax=Kineococcus sp. R86509 TaxID=3093851 RepID=UPI0036D31FB9
MDLQFRDRVVLVVGGRGLIGAALTDRLRTEGATVVVASRNPGEGVVLDGSDDASVQAGVEEVLRTHGRIDAVVVTAAPSARTLDPERRSDPAQVLEAFDGKAMVFLRIANAVVPSMRAAGFGRIVVVSGQNALLTGNITGSVRNAATIVVAKNLADDLAGTGISVNAVNPGLVTADPQAAVAVGAPGESTPAQVADLLAFLASPLNAVTGESIAVGHRVRGVTSF